jgi:hypothetical protein
MIELFPAILEIMLANIFKVLLFIGFFVFDVMFLGIPAEQAAFAIGGAFGGAMVLAYIKREKEWIERVVKTICSATAAIFIAPAFNKYYGIESKEFVGLSFFLISIMSLIILRALINMTEQNAAGAIKQIFIKVFNIQVKEPPRKRRDTIHITKGEN